MPKKRLGDEDDLAESMAAGKAKNLTDHTPEFIEEIEETEAAGPLAAVGFYAIVGTMMLGVGSFLFLVLNSLLFGSEDNWKDNIFSAVNGRSLPANITGACIYISLLCGYIGGTCICFVEAVRKTHSFFEIIKVVSYGLFIIGLMANEYFDGNPLLASVFLGLRDAFILALAFCVCLLVIGFVIGFYFLPTVLATKPWLEGENLHERHPQFVPLAIVNFFFGATVIGWVGCLAWAFWKFDKPDSDYVSQVGKDESPENGKHVVYYDNGQKKSEAHYKDGKLDGLYIEWHSNGKKSSEAQHKDGKLDGLLTMWYTNGQKSEEAQHKDGKLDGLLTRWDKNGRKDSEVQYKDGLIVTHKTFKRS